MKGIITTTVGVYSSLKYSRLVSDDKCKTVITEAISMADADFRYLLNNELKASVF